MLNELLPIVVRAGKLSLRWFGALHQGDIAFKKESDLVTVADETVEEFLRVELKKAFPDFGFLGEETGGDTTGKHFVVDPIDGTTNFVHGVPYYAISVAAKEGKKTLAGAVYLPAMDCLYSAEQNGTWM